MPELVADADLITPEWLTEVLTGSGSVRPDARLDSFSHSRIGTGKLGDMVRFDLEWAGASEDAGPLPQSVVGKFASADPTSRQAGLMTGIYVREICFYQELAAGMTMRIPRCHFAELNYQTGEFALILEDITPSSQGSQVAGCNLEQAEIAMDEAAKLHSSVWGASELGGRDWLTPRSENNGEGLTNIYIGLVGQFLEQYDDRLSDAAKEATQRFTPLVSSWLCTDSQLPFTLLHGDYRLENMLFGTGESAPPLCTVDWQTVTLGAGPSDVSYFIGAGLLPPERRDHERELLERYRVGLASGGVDLDPDELWASYRVNAFAGLHMAVIASVLVGRTEHGDEMFLTMAERHTEQVNDLDAWSLVAG